MPKYEFESTRWLRSQGKAHWVRNDFDTASTFRTVAEEIDNLRNDNAKIEAALEALREACRPVACAYVTAKNNVKWSGETIKAEDMAFPGVTVAQMDVLAELVGEEGK